MSKMTIAEYLAAKGKADINKAVRVPTNSANLA